MNRRAMSRRSAARPAGANRCRQADLCRGVPGYVRYAAGLHSARRTASRPATAPAGLDREGRLAVKVGIPREVKTHEYRVAITPAGVHELVSAGHQVYVEKDAGVG